ncbi:MAG: hypothetical protein VZR00_02545 [Lachnospiraceae bacterium]|jgi:hypothetical protein|nr:hypothetical protein [Lachnospiraceae bacterium]
MSKNIRYSEPADYFPEELRKEFKIGEYAEDESDEEEKKSNTEEKHLKTSDKAKS